MRIRLASAIFLVVLFVLVVTPGRGKEPADSLDGPPLTTAAAWAIADFKTGELLWGHNPSAPRNIASTTKIMTAWIVLDRAAVAPMILEETVTISERADKTGGSSANVETGERITVSELLYGLLLPSGNDAAVALAEHFGERLCPHTVAEGDGGAAPSGDEPAADPLALFMAEMNRRAENLGMDQTRYLDPHGMSDNLSSADDLILLTRQAMQNERFRRYVATTEHTATLVAADATERQQAWKNTNRLLNIEGFDGVKTGTTSAAGECLVSSGQRGDDHLLVVVLGASSGGRYVDTRNLFRWAWSQRAAEE